MDILYCSEFEGSCVVKELTERQIQAIDENDAEAFCFKDGKFHHARVHAIDEGRNLEWVPM